VILRRKKKRPYYIICCTIQLERQRVIDKMFHSLLLSKIMWSPFPNSFLKCFWRLILFIMKKIVNK